MQLAGALLQPGALRTAAGAGQIDAQGGIAAFERLAGLLDDFPTAFALTHSNT
jgi:hypothetical protein